MAHKSAAIRATILMSALEWAMILTALAIRKKLDRCVNGMTVNFTLANVLKMIQVFIAKNLNCRKSA